ncbi:MAG: hypothetical protein FGM41_02175 [Bacteroidetes bacterium]|nr:hypothetical protein [Bacteroidota bacterium]
MLFQYQNHQPSTMNHEPQNTKHKIFQLTEKFLEIVRNSSIILTFYPTKIYACASSSSWVTGRNTQDPDPANHFNTLTAPCISSSLMNYYLNSIQSLAIQYQQPFERAVIIGVGDERARISTCSPWASNPNPNFNTGTSIDNGICPQGQHWLGITYKNLVLVPIGL